MARQRGKNRGSPHLSPLPIEITPTEIEITKGRARIRSKMGRENQKFREGGVKSTKERMGIGGKTGKERGKSPHLQAPSKYK